MVKFFFIGIAIAAFTGCAAQVETMPTPDGKQGYLIKCDGSADSWGTCYKAANAACNGGSYKIVDRNETSMPTAYGPLVRRYLIAQCN